MNAKEKCSLSHFTSVDKIVTTVCSGYIISTRNFRGNIEHNHLFCSASFFCLQVHDHDKRGANIFKTCTEKWHNNFNR